MQAILEQLIDVDEQLFIFLNNLGSPKWDTLWLWITEKKSWIPFYALLLGFSIYKLKKWKLILAFIISVALLITLVDQSITQIFKPGFGRFRPCHFHELDGLFRLVQHRCGGKYSFFSSHAANSFALAYLVSHVVYKNKWFTYFMFAWAATVAYSRIYVGVHYPLDITIGAIWGSLLAWGITKLFFRIKPRLH